MEFYRGGVKPPLISYLLNNVKNKNFVDKKVVKTDGISGKIPIFAFESA